ncbi:hypothetical protein EK904_004583 [Melospiza melodia maxima]|nr:hypothetical protein EK904_004583 [Melospiza melodia maxima]
MRANKRKPFAMSTQFLGQTPKGEDSTASPDKCLWYLAVNGSAAQTQGNPLPSLCPIADGGVLSNGCCGGHGLSVRNLSLSRAACGGLLMLELTALGSCYSGFEMEHLRPHQLNHCKFLLIHPAGLIG